MSLSSAVGNDIQTRIGFQHPDILTPSFSLRVGLGAVFFCVVTSSSGFAWSSFRRTPSEHIKVVRGGGVRGGGGGVRGGGGGDVDDEECTRAEHGVPDRMR